MGDVIKKVLINVITLIIVGALVWYFVLHKLFGF
jgi:hypothetical protein